MFGKKKFNYVEHFGREFGSKLWCFTVLTFKSKIKCYELIEN